MKTKCQRKWERRTALSLKEREDFLTGLWGCIGVFILGAGISIMCVLAYMKEMGI